MSFTGKIEAQCPKGCEPYAADAWSFVRGDDLRLRDGLLAGDLNLLVCPECRTLFYPETTVVYYDPAAALLAFILPESYRKDEPMWRGKIREDYVAMREALAKDMPVDIEPTLLFGMDAVRRQLQRDDDLEDEVLVAGHLCREMGLPLYPVDRGYAREHDLPWTIPFHRAKPGSGASVEAMLAGLDELLQKNDRLEGYAKWRERLRAERALPPNAPTGSGS